MKNNSTEMPKPSPEVLTKMIQDLKDFNATIATKIKNEEANELRGNYYLRKNYAKEWLNALPSTFYQERDEIINLILDLGEIIAKHNVKMANAILKYADGINTDNQVIAAEVSDMLHDLKAMMVAEDVVVEKKENKATFIAILITLFILLRIVMALMR